VGVRFSKIERRTHLNFQKKTCRGGGGVRDPVPRGRGKKNGGEKKEGT